MSVFSKRKAIALLSAAAVATGVVTGSTVFNAKPVRAADLSDSAATVRALSDTFASVTEKAAPSVVFITVEKEFKGRPASYQGQGSPEELPELFKHFFGPGMQGPEEGQAPRGRMPFGQGSGFIISTDGYIVTNHHVVGDADQVKVTLKDGRDFTAKIIGSDPQTEIALIKIEADGLPAIPLANSDTLRSGEWVLAIGSPFGLQQTVTSGIVSAAGRGDVGIVDYANFIQTDAAINPGNSGGPLLNMNGEVVGMNTAIISSSGGSNGIGFAIPINMVKYITDQLRNDGKITRGYLGLGIQNLTPDLAKWFNTDQNDGALVTEIVPGSPAEQAGLKPNDVIVEFNGQPVKDSGSFRSRVSTTPTGTDTPITVMRDRERVQLSVRVGEKESEGQIVADAGESSRGSGNLGLSLQPLTDDVASRLGYEGKQGVLVAQVTPGSPAARANIRPGDLIKQVNQQEVHNLNDFKEALKANKDNNTLLYVQKGDMSAYVTLDAA